MTVDDIPGPDHPAPHRDRVSPFWLLAGLAIPPGAWLTEMLLGVGIASNGCGLIGSAVRARGFAGESAVLLAITALCLVATGASGFMSRRHWLTVRGEKDDSEHSHVTVGDGRTRFLALAGMLNAVTFAIAISFSLLEPVLIPMCWSAR